MRLAVRAESTDQGLIDAIYKTYDVTKWVELPKVEQETWEKIAEHCRECETKFMFVQPKSVNAFEYSKSANTDFYSFRWQKKMTKGELKDVHEDILDAWNYPCETIIFFPGKEIQL